MICFTFIYNNLTLHLIQTSDNGVKLKLRIQLQKDSLTFDKLNDIELKNSAARFFLSEVFAAVAFVVALAKLGKGRSFH